MQYDSIESCTFFYQKQDRDGFFRYHSRSLLISLFRHLCRLGKIEIASWLICCEQFPVPSYDKELQFLNCTKGTWIPLLKLIRVQWHFPVSTYLFENICKTNDLEAARWVLNLLQEAHIPIRRGWLMNIVYLQCDHGHFRLVQWLLTLVEPLSNKEIQTVFAIACAAPRSKLALWILQHYNPANISEGFLCACLGGCLEIVKGLRSKLLDSSVDSSVDSLKPNYFISEIHNWFDQDLSFFNSLPNQCRQQIVLVNQNRTYYENTIEGKFVPIVWTFPCLMKYGFQAAAFGGHEHIMEWIHNHRDYDEQHDTLLWPFVETYPFYDRVYRWITNHVGPIAPEYDIFHHYDLKKNNRAFEKTKIIDHAIELYHYGDSTAWNLIKQKFDQSRWKMIILNNFLRRQNDFKEESYNNKERLNKYLRIIWKECFSCVDDIVNADLIHKWLKELTTVTQPYITSTLLQRFKPYWNRTALIEYAHEQGVSIQYCFCLFLFLDAKRERKRVQFMKRVIRSKWPHRFCMTHFPRYFNFLVSIRNSLFHVVWKRILSKFVSDVSFLTSSTTCTYSLKLHI